MSSSKQDYYAGLLALFIGLTYAEVKRMQLYCGICHMPIKTIII